MKHICRIIIVAGCILITSMVSKRRTEAELIRIRDNVATFCTPQGDLYEWEIEPDDDFTVGKSYKLVMFDYDDCNTRNDAIYKVVAMEN